MAIRHSNATVNKCGHRSFGIGSASANPGDHTVSFPNECMELESVQLTACVVRGVSSRLLEHDEPGRTLERLGSHGMREGSSHLTVTYTTPHNTSLTHVPWTQVLNVPNTTVKIGIIGGTGGPRSPACCCAHACCAVLRVLIVAAVLCSPLR